MLLFLTKVDIMSLNFLNEKIFFLVKSLYKKKIETKAYKVRNIFKLLTEYFCEIRKIIYE